MVWLSTTEVRVLRGGCCREAFGKEKGVRCLRMEMNIQAKQSYTCRILYGSNIDNTC